MEGGKGKFRTEGERERERERDECMEDVRLNFKGGGREGREREMTNRRAEVRGGGKSR